MASILILKPRVGHDLGYKPAGQLFPSGPVCLKVRAGCRGRSWRRGRHFIHRAVSQRTISDLRPPLNPLQHHRPTRFAPPRSPANLRALMPLIAKERN